MTMMAFTEPLPKTVQKLPIKTQPATPTRPTKTTLTPCKTRTKMWQFLRMLKITIPTITTPITTTMPLLTKITQIGAADTTALPSKLTAILTTGAMLLVLDGTHPIMDTTTLVGIIMAGVPLDGTRLIMAMVIPILDGTITIITRLIMGITTTTALTITTATTILTTQAEEVLRTIITATEIRTETTPTTE